MKLSQAQIDLLDQLGTDPEKGLTADEAVRRREQSGSFNTVDPPIKCPGWICCLLPCIKHVPSMKAFRQIKPDDAELLRGGKWIRYDAASLVKGDIIRLEEGDIVPADCVVLSLEHTAELLVDHRSVTGEDKPRSATLITTNGDSSSDDEKKRPTTTQPTQLFWGGRVVQGSAIAVATAVGSSTLVALLIRDGRFPPQGNVVVPTTVGEFSSEDPDEEAGISLMTRDVL